METIFAIIQIYFIVINDEKRHFWVLFGCIMRRIMDERQKKFKSPCKVDFCVI